MNASWERQHLLWYSICRPEVVGSNTTRPLRVIAGGLFFCRSAAENGIIHHGQPRVINDISNCNNYENTLDFGVIRRRTSLMLWKLLCIQNLERLWIPSVGQNFGTKVQLAESPAPRPVRLRLYRNGRFY